MSNDSTESHHPTWFERLSRALIREPHNREQLIYLLRDAEHRHLLNAEALSMIEGVLQVSELQARDIMIPRAQMVIVEAQKTLESFLPTIIESGHSRFPVIEEDRDHILGILHAKDLLQYIFHKRTDFNLEEIVRPAVFVPESKRLDTLLKEFRVNRNHMAIVVDEYGGAAGLITIEDIIEQIVGEIEDEFDIDEDAYIKKHSEQEYVIKALTPIEEFNEYFHTKFSDEEFDTLGGLVTKIFGHLPKSGESIQMDQYQFTVLRADKRRIHLLKMTL